MKEECLCLLDSKKDDEVAVPVCAQEHERYYLNERWSGQAWHFLTSTFMLCGKRGTFWHRPSCCVAGVALLDIDRPSCCVAGVALGNIVLTTIFLIGGLFLSCSCFRTRQASKVLGLSVNLMSVWLALFFFLYIYIYISFCVPKWCENGCVQKWCIRLRSEVILLPFWLAGWLSGWLAAWLSGWLSIYRHTGKEFPD